MTNDKLKDAIIEEEEIEYEYDRDRVNEHDVELTLYNKRKVFVESRLPTNNEQLFNVEQLLSSEIAILLNRRVVEGDLSREDWKRLNDIVEMKLKLSKLELQTKQASILEGKSNQEIIDLVESAKEALTEEDDDNE